MKRTLKKGCVTLKLRTAFLIVSVLSIVVFGVLAAAFPTIYEKFMKNLTEKSVTDPDLLHFVTPLTQLGNKIKIVIRALGSVLCLASLILLASWFQMNKYAGTGPDPGMFSCFKAANPVNLNKRKKLKWWMLPWLVLECLFFLAVVFLTAEAILKISKYKVGITTFIIPPILLIILGLIQAYSILVVVSFYYEQTSTVA